MSQRRLIANRQAGLGMWRRRRPAILPVPPTDSIRWDTGGKATITAGAGAIATLQVAPGTLPAIEILRPAHTADDRGLLFQSLLWALDEAKRRSCRVPE